LLFIALVVLSLFAIGGSGVLATAIAIDPAGSWPSAYIAGGALLLQGVFTLFLISSASRRWRAGLDVVFIAGEITAAVVGSAALVSSILYNLSTRGEYEFAPVTLAGIMFVHAAVGLVWAAGDEGFAEPLKRGLRRGNS
jgi:hypothetical protein